MKLKLNDDINTDFVRFKGQRRYNRAPHPFKTFEEFLVDIYIHEHSNYEDVMWSFWKRDKDFCMKEMESLLMQISNIGKSLVWECLETLKKYQKKYEDHHYKSQFVRTDDTSMGLITRVA